MSDKGEANYVRKKTDKRDTRHHIDYDTDTFYLIARAGGGRYVRPRIRRQESQFGYQG